jgi:hypothetical protein
MQKYIFMSEQKDYQWGLRRGIINQLYVPDFYLEGNTSSIYSVNTDLNIYIYIYINTENDTQSAILCTEGPDLLENYVIRLTSVSK